MGVKLLPPRLYKSELANKESLRDTLLLVELETERDKRKRRRNVIYQQAIVEISQKIYY